MPTDVLKPHRVALSADHRSLLLAPVRSPVPLTLMVLTALAVTASGAIHLYLWDIAYRHVATLGPLFLLQAFQHVRSGYSSDRPEAGLRSALRVRLMLGTLIGFVLVLTTGLFGFKLGFVSGWAYLTMGADPRRWH